MGVSADATTQKLVWQLCDALDGDPRGCLQISHHWFHPMVR